MKKQLAIVLVFALLLPVLAGCQSAITAQEKQKPASTPATVAPEKKTVTSTAASPTVTRDKALEIALTDTDLTQNEIYNLDIELDRDKGVLQYDVDFEKDSKDYNYEIHAETGEILKKEVPTAPAQTPVKPEKPAEKPVEKPAERLTKEEAIALALAHAGLTKEQIRDLEVELDKERGVLHYEVDFASGAYEYEYEIHAETGEILKAEKERD